MDCLHMSDSLERLFNNWRGGRCLNFIQICDKWMCVSLDALTRSSKSGRFPRVLRYIFTRNDYKVVDDFPDLSRNTPGVKFMLYLLSFSYFFSSPISLAQIRRLITTDWLVITQAAPLTPVPSPFPQRSCLASSSSRSTWGAPPTGTDRSKLMTRLYRWVRPSGVSLPFLSFGCMFHVEFWSLYFFFVFSLYDVHSLLSHYVFVCFFERPRAIIFIFLAPQPARIEMLIKKELSRAYSFRYKPMSGYTTFIHFQIARSRHPSRPNAASWNVKRIQAILGSLHCILHTPPLHARSLLFIFN